LQAQLVENEREIAHRKAAEEHLARTGWQLRRTNQDLSQFAYAAAHDLQEPLRNVSHILTLLKLSRGDTPDEEAFSLIDNGIAGLHRMHQMVTGLLEFSKIEGPQNSPSIVDTNSVLREVLGNLSTAILEIVPARRAATLAASA
jgi:light-regulated signal transduction histidine kinase (bacteriophytochrome)